MTALTGLLHAEAPAADTEITCLDAGAMRLHLQPLLSAAAGRPVLIDAVQIDTVRRTTSRRRQPHPMTLCYAVQVAGAAAPARFYARSHRPGASGAAALAAPHALHLPALGLLLWPWPADPGLPQLPALLDPAQARPWWGHAAETVQALRHRPEQRATLCYRHPDQPAPLYAKTFHDARGAQLQRRFQHFWQQAQADPGAPLVAQPLGYHADTRAFWQAAAPGAPLQHVVAGAGRPALADALAGAWLAVHRAPPALADGARRDRPHWLAELARRQQKLARALPALAADAQHCIQALAEAARQLDDAPLVLIHGDAHPEQLWLHGDRPVLFDFDEFTLGDPMEDLAAFVTKLEPLDAHGTLSQAVVASYAARAPALFCTQRLGWHLAVQQVLQASRSFVYQVPGWPAAAAARLARAQALAARPADALSCRSPA